uniref:Uncharacterized protein n=1 Tax=Pyrodinium bahamense TaxID=73915 RepID=A0A7S0ABX3_9DINO|mmetsp:Transcript_30427/g.83862  ORF Transcript_30427/g.83862 Transcript_30427/m.83862 type:complete len:594 (+) Transcript_30427:49-1830(+)
MTTQPPSAAKIAEEIAKHFPTTTPDGSFDPAHKFTHFVLVCSLLILVLFLCLYWRTLLNWISEDNVLRCDRFYLQYWGFLQCCGLCDGEWTRCVSGLCCCCCEKLKGRNLKRALGEWLGLSPVAIRVQNIMLGGLPRRRHSWISRSPDVYLQILPDELQPTLNTEVAVQANIDCVQFTSGITLMIKNNVHEDPVRFCARELCMVGSREIADCYVCPARLISWARHNKKVRIQLSPTHEYNDPSRNPWVLLDLSIPPEMDYLRRSSVGTFAPIVLETESTGSSPASDGKSLLESFGLHSTDPLSSPLHSKLSPGSSGLCFPECSPRPKPTQSLVLLPMQSSIDYTMYHKPREFMGKYPLWNAHGLQVREQEDSLGRESVRVHGYIRVSLFCWVVPLAVYTVTRFYTTTCIEEFRQTQVVWNYTRQQNISFPPCEDVSNDVVELCGFVRTDLSKFALSLQHHKWFHSYTESRIMCNPPVSEIITFCRDFHKIGGRRPTVFDRLTCFPRSCQIDLFLQDSDFTILLFLFLFGILVFMARACIISTSARQVLEQPPRENIEALYDYLAARTRSSRETELFNSPSKSSMEEAKSPLKR